MQWLLRAFCGGANLIDKIHCSTKIGNDVNKYLIALLDHVSRQTDDLPNTISKEEYDAVRVNFDGYPDWYVGLVGFCASYNSKWFGGYANNVRTKIGTIRNYTDEAIRNLKKQAPALKDIIFVTGDFRNLEVSNMVIYCDPPYKATTKYGTPEFPYDDFYAWCKRMAAKNVVLISEYQMPEDDFECIWQGKLKCTLDKNSRTDRIEKLYICKGGKHD